MVLKESLGSAALAAPFVPDELVGYEAFRFSLPQEDDGPLWATLVRKNRPSPAADRRPAVLYVHGFCDYFFQTHLSDAIEAAGFNFYAIDLRRYGRSIAEGNRANQARDISDYFFELDWALHYLLQRHGRIGGLVAHSTGGLILSHYLRQSDLKDKVPCLVLNSVFVKFNLSPVNRMLLAPVVQLGAFAPYRRLPQQMPGRYGQTLHKSEQGEWDYNLKYKPINGFPLFPAWFRMIKRAQDQTAAGLGLRLPILSMRSLRSRPPTSAPSEEDFRTDIVLNVEHIRKLSPLLGPHVRDCIIENGIHDLYLSNEMSRSIALSETTEFLKEYGLR